MMKIQVGYKKTVGVAMPLPNYKPMINQSKMYNDKPTMMHSSRKTGMFLDFNGLCFFFSNILNNHLQFYLIVILFEILKLSSSAECYESLIEWFLLTGFWLLKNVSDFHRKIGSSAFYVCRTNFRAYSDWTDRTFKNSALFC